MMAEQHRQGKARSA